jgi:hypothetical protein
MTYLLQHYVDCRVILNDNADCQGHLSSNSRVSPLSSPLPELVIFGRSEGPALAPSTSP